MLHIPQCIFSAQPVKVWSDTSLGVFGRIISHFHGYGDCSCLCQTLYTLCGHNEDLHVLFVMEANISSIKLQTSEFGHFIFLIWSFLFDSKENSIYFVSRVNLNGEWLELS